MLSIALRWLGHTHAMTGDRLLAARFSLLCNWPLHACSIASVRPSSTMGPPRHYPYRKPLDQPSRESLWHVRLSAKGKTRIWQSQQGHEYRLARKDVHQLTFSAPFPCANEQALHLKPTYQIVTAHYHLAKLGPKPGQSELSDASAAVRGARRCVSASIHSIHNASAGLERSEGFGICSGRMALPMVVNGAARCRGLAHQAW